MKDQNTYDYEGNHGEEEDEDEYYDEEPGLSIEDEILSSMWSRFKELHPFPAYAIVLASQLDSNAVELVQNHRKELSNIAGIRCCFLYFRNLDRAKLLEPFEYAEHAKWVYPLARTIGIDIDDLPCIIFFENIASGDYAFISLKGKSPEDALIILRDAFGHVESHSKSKTFRALQSHNRLKALRITAQTISNNVLQMGKDITVELLKSLFQLP